VSTADGLPDGSVFEAEQASPTVPRMVVGLRLRLLREAQGISREDAGFAIRSSASKISRLELGRASFKLRDLVDLCTLYGVTDHMERLTLLGLARRANSPGWWHAYRDVIPSWFEPYLGLEQAASVIRTYESQFVPGLLQCREYARAVITLGHGDAPTAEIERRVDLRMRRQQILHRPNAPHLWAVIDEAVLRRPIGDRATMLAQVRYLLEICQLPQVSVQIMSFRRGGHAAGGGPITLLRLPDLQLPDVVYLEQLTTAQYPDRPGDVAYYQHVMNLMVTQAELVSATPDFLSQVFKEMKSQRTLSDAEPRRYDTRPSTVQPASTAQKH
jgi:transcriptional regulator with XRE-family HTH domain